MDVRAWAARRLERGIPPGPLRRWAARAWESAVRVRRPLHWRESARVITIGGATLGGSGKTPLAIACVEALRRAGIRATLVAHAYRAKPGCPRRVSPSDDVRAVGDEALEAARRLAGLDVPVVVARTRQDAVDLALRFADVAVVDGPLQVRPMRATLSLLAVDAEAPWGSARCPPLGDLRARVSSLLDAADRVAAIGPSDALLAPLPSSKPIDLVIATSRGAWLEGELLPWSELAGLRIGLWTTLARPRRVLDALRRRGVLPVLTFAAADHAGGVLPSARTVRLPTIDLWVCTAKCRTHLPSHGPGDPTDGSVATLDYSLELGPDLTQALEIAGLAGREAGRAVLDPCLARP